MGAGIRKSFFPGMSITRRFFVCLIASRCRMLRSRFVRFMLICLFLMTGLSRVVFLFICTAGIEVEGSSEPRLTLVYSRCQTC